MLNNHKLDLVNMNAYIKFDDNISIFPHDIERKRNYDGWKNTRTNGMTDNPNHI